ncbi:MAG TPA: LPS-assembly protein LptD [Thermodesulfobacteriaceae bacterium]|nr:LPS-assembly protein LptD [Thermodesulfobacteriaceae bacterium]
MNTFSRGFQGIIFVVLFLSGLPAVGSSAGAVETASHDLPGQTESLADSDSKPDFLMEPWAIEACRLTFFQGTDTVMGEGAVRVSRDDLEITADRIIYDMGRGRIKSSGSVVIRLGQDVLRGEEGELDLNTHTGTITDGHLYLKRNNIHLLADNISKVGPEEYRAEEAVISTCPLPKQAWSFKCSDLKLTVDGMAIAKQTTFNIRDIPVLWSPWVVVPINRYRKTGLLLPYFSSSDRNGIGINVPFFWAINDSMDATFYQNPMNKRGWMQGAEFRYMFSPYDTGIFRFNFLRDRIEDQDFNKDGYFRDNNTRWWIRGKANHHLPWDIEAKLDLNLISDRDYLLEFDKGPMGFEATDRVFLDHFGRSLTDRTDISPASTIQFAKKTQNFFGGLAGRYNDNLAEGEQEKAIQTAPKLVFHGFKQRIMDTPVFYDFDSSFVHYWSDTGLRDLRLDISPRLSTPVNLFGWADLLLSAGGAGTFYNVSGDDPAQNPDDNPARGTGILAAELTSTFGRTFFRDSRTLWRHDIRPKISYGYRKSTDQDDLPIIDTKDRLYDSSRVTWSILSYLSSRSRTGNNNFSYRDLVRVYMEQSYEFDDPESFESHVTGLEPRRLSDLLFELDIRPSDRFFLRYDTTVNFYGDGFTRHKILGSFLSSAGDHLDFAYLYNSVTRNHQLNADLTLVLTPSWTVHYMTKRSLNDNTIFESAFGVRYQSTCWSLEGMIQDDQEDTSILVYLELLGIGRWGTGI